MPWKEEGTVHNRKYLVVPGAVVDPKTKNAETTSTSGSGANGKRHPIGTQDSRPGGGLPSHVLPRTAPARGAPSSSHQNTDPIVFGDSFGYSNCKQYKQAMQGMPPGSLVLFGRGMKVHGERRFVLDTCFVVDHGTRPASLERPSGPGARAFSTTWSSDRSRLRTTTSGT